VTAPIDITDARLVKALAHPLRLRILSALQDRVASPSEIAAELGAPLSNTSYHVRQLASLGFLELVDRAARRGAIEHYYTAVMRPTVTDEAWTTLPPIIKRALVNSGLGEGLGRVVSAAESGGFDADDAHYSRTTATLDREGWDAVATVLARALQEIDTIVVDATARRDKGASTDGIGASVIMMLFEDSSQARSVASRRGGQRRSCPAMDALPE
jgi:DNA-binding transcriptional ArsR family regulator